MLREVGLDFAKEMCRPVGGFDFAAHVERDPLGPGGDHADVVLPGVCFDRVLHHFLQRGLRQGAVKVAKGALPDRLDDLLGIRIAGQDYLGVRADRADAAEQFQRVEAVGAGGDDHIEGAPTDPVQGQAAVGDFLDLPVVPLQEAGQVSGGIGIEEQQAAGVQKFSTL